MRECADQLLIVVPDFEFTLPVKTRCPQSASAQHQVDAFKFACSTIMLFHMQAGKENQKSLSLPLGISEGEATLEGLRQLPAGLELAVPDNYEALVLSSELDGEVFAIQRLLTISRLGIPITVAWAPAICQRLPGIALLQPLLAVALMLQDVDHRFAGLGVLEAEKVLSTARHAVLNHRLDRDLFSPSQLLLCADSRGYGRPEQLYLPRGGALRPRSHFETVVQDVLSTELKATGDTAKQFKWANSLGVIVAELFENTDIHAMTDLGGARFRTNAMRGLMFKRTKLTVQLRDSLHKLREVEKECLEISVFDTGLGYFRSYTRSDEKHDIEFEWRVMHNCLERHFFSDIPDHSPAHRALGLAEVLRALQTLAGRIEIRTGRTFGYRTFIEGQLQAQMQPPGSDWSRFNWPKPRLLDFTKKVVAVPTAHEDIVGSAIRVIVPLN